MDVARFLVRTKYSLMLNETINVEINDHVYRIKMVEDMHGPKHIFITHDSIKGDLSEDSNMEEEYEMGSASNE